MSDPRARRVVESVRTRGRTYRLKLECGHTVARSFMCLPDRVVCHWCPSAGGIGGNGFHPSNDT
jgi:hypothetical protein